MADTEEYFPRGGKKPTTTHFKQNANVRLQLHVKRVLKWWFQIENIY